MLVAAAAAAIFVYSQTMLFVVQPIGAIPEGVTVLAWRLNSMKFIDSADAWCEREMGGVSLICRMGVLGKVGKSNVVLLRLPYSRTLYLASTGGVDYDR